MTDFVLKIIDLFKWIFKLLGVDYRKFRALLKVKLMTDNRQDKSITQRRSEKPMSNSMIWVMVIYAFMGLFSGLLLIGMKSLFTALLFVHSITMVMTTVALISDFTSVLLDTTDNSVLLHRPIDSRTLVLARITHIILYLLQIIFSLSIAAMIIGTIKYGFLFLVLFLASLMFSVLFVVFLSNVFYLFLIRISGQNRFKEIILYFQIFMAAFAMGSYQILPRLIGQDFLQTLTFQIRWWTYLMPPAWMAAPIDAAVSGKMTTEYAFLTALGILVPLSCVFFVVRFLAPGFSRALSQLDIHGSEKKERSTHDSLVSRMSHLVSRRPAEKAVFRLVWRLSSRDRKFKLKTYPTFGYMVIIAGVLTLRDNGSIIQAFTSLPETKKYLIFLYLGCLLIPMVILQMRLSDQYLASWIYRGLPFSSPGVILKGGIKSMVVKYGFSVFVPLSIMIIFIWGFHVIDDILLAASNMVLFSYLIAIPGKNDFPFAKSYTGARDAQKGVAGFIMLFAPGFMGLAHFGLTDVPFAVLLALPVSALLIYPFSRYFENMKWESYRT
ncbi:hypothetical protein ACFLT9_14565 [Acidobacteriota bacterium]